MDQEFKILITGDATSGVAAAQQMGAATNKLKVDTSDLSDETKRQLGILDPVAQAKGKVAIASKEVAEATGIERREARELGNELGNLAGIHRLGGAAVGSMGAAIFGLVASLEFLKSTWDDMQDAVKGEIDIKVKDDASATIQALADAWNNYATALAKARAAANSPETNANRDLENLREELKLRQEIIKAIEAEQLANLATKKDSMSPQAYEQAQAGIKAAFEGNATGATDDEKQAEINRKRQEAADLEKASAENKARGEAAAGRAGTTSTVEKNAESAAAAADKISADIEMVQRYIKSLAGGDVPEYEGATGKAQQASDFWKIDKMAGADQDQNDVLKNLQQQLAQAQSEIALGKEAKRQDQAGTEATTKAADQKAKAEALRREADTEQGNLDAEKNNQAVTKGLGDAGSALGALDAAKANNTPSGFRDAQAAMNNAGKVIVEIAGVMKNIGDTHSENFAVLLAAVQHLSAEVQSVKRQQAQAGYNAK